MYSSTEAHVEVTATKTWLHKEPEREASVTHGSFSKIRIAVFKIHK